LTLHTYFANIRQHDNKRVTTMSKDSELLTEIRDLLLLMAEPALAKRDERLRGSLQQIVGKSRPKAEAVVLMDGTRTQSDIRKECTIDAGALSRLVKSLRDERLIGPDAERPKVVFPVPSNLADIAGRDKG